MSQRDTHSIVVEHIGEAVERGRASDAEHSGDRDQLAGHKPRLLRFLIWRLRRAAGIGAQQPALGRLRELFALVNPSQLVFLDQLCKTAIAELLNEPFQTGFDCEIRILSHKMRLDQILI